MKVKIGDKIYDAEKEPIMVILSDNDKYNISHMRKIDRKYCVYPERVSIKDLEKFMDIKEDFV